MSTPTYEFQSDFARRFLAQGKAEGKAEGEAAAVIGFLEARGVPVSPAARDRIAQCSDLDQLGRWIRLAATVNSADDLFA